MSAPTAEIPSVEEALVVASAELASALVEARAALASGVRDREAVETFEQADLALRLVVVAARRQLRTAARRAVCATNHVAGDARQETTR